MAPGCWCYFSTETLLSSASFSSLMTWSAFSAKGSLCVTAIVCSIALNLDSARARRSIEPSSVPRLSSWFVEEEHA